MSAMTVVGKVESLWRYPVKSMRGERVRQSYLGFSGAYGDRLYAFHDTAAPEGFPFLTGREQEQLLLYQPRFRHPDAALPPNIADTEGDEPGLTPVYASADLSVDIETPSGEVLAIDDPNLIARLAEGLDGIHALALLRSDRSFTDCRPVSIFSLQTVNQLGDELGFPLDQRRFRANIYADLTPMAGFAENSFIGRRLQIGPKAVIAVTDRDPRCKMITLDPNTAEASPEVLRRVRDVHEGKAGLYGAVLVEGTVRPGDEIRLLD
jgi:MOSC domain-containing protein